MKITLRAFLVIDKRSEAAPKVLVTNVGLKTTSRFRKLLPEKRFLSMIHKYDFGHLLKDSQYVEYNISKNEERIETDEFYKPRD